MRIVFILIALMSFVSVVALASSNARTRSLKDAIGDDLIDGNWIYEDIKAGYKQAKKSGKPLLVSFR